MQGNLLFKGDTSVGATFVIFQILVQGQKTVVVEKVVHIYFFFLTFQLQEAASPAAQLQSGQPSQLTGSH